MRINIKKIVDKKFFSNAVHLKVEYYNIPKNNSKDITINPKIERKHYSYSISVFGFISGFGCGPINSKFNNHTFDELWITKHIRTIFLVLPSLIRNGKISLNKAEKLEKQLYNSRNKYNLDIDYLPLRDIHNRILPEQQKELNKYFRKVTKYEK